MMNKEEVKTWFLTKLNSCYPIQHRQFKANYYLYFSEHFLRQLKFARILNEEDEIVFPTEIVDNLFFYIKEKENVLDIEYYTIWKVLEESLETIDQNLISETISGWLKQDNNQYKELEPRLAYFLKQGFINEKKWRKKYTKPLI